MFSIENKLLSSIEKSKNTTLDKFLFSLSIPMIGKSTSKIVAKICNYDYDSFVTIMSSDGENAFKNTKGIGKEMRKSLHVWFNENKDMMRDLAQYLSFKKTE